MSEVIAMARRATGDSYTDYRVAMGARVLWPYDTKVFAYDPVGVRVGEVLLSTFLAPGTEAKVKEWSKEDAQKHFEGGS